ncbi:MAG TPA: SDR family NAD(P)-dependent oxidoreductase [Pirellulales bacterium]|jgi:short-subunit dehydrogenase|nr:SDR family NAD(P)-dependent oxidoreductase [Pirellulales bacterium]
MHRSISGARALVTGASGGLGRAIALELARHGANVMLLARREEKLREVSQEISQLSNGVGRAEFVVGDVTDPAVRTTALAAMQEKFGGLDILVNNAGVGTLARFATGDPQFTRQVFETNFFAAVELTREALPLLKSGRQPIVVNIGSILGHRATPQNSDYCASKFALRGWSEALRIELAPLGIDVLLVSPGSTATEFWNNLVGKQGEVPWSLKGALTADVTARAIVRGMAHGKREIIPGFRARWFVRGAYWVPQLFDRILKRFA